MVKVSGATAGRPRDRADRAPHFALWSDQNFQEAWVKSVRTDLQAFKDAVWEMNFENLSSEDAKTWTQRLGLPIPKEAEDYKLALMCLRSIVRYSEWKLAAVERAATRYAEDQRIALEKEKT